MKKISIILFGLLSLNALAKDLSSRKELLEDIKSETKKCAIQIVSGQSDEKSVIGYKSTCSNLIITSPTEAKMFLEGEWINAKIIESQDTDGGDLDDLIITNAEGKVLATKTNIPAYDSIVIAMAGDSNFPKKAE